MTPTRLVRIMGIILLVLIASASASLNAYGVVKLTETISDLYFFALGALLTLAFQLIVKPKRFLGIAEPEQERSERTLKTNAAEVNAFKNAIMREIDNISEFFINDLRKQGVIFTGPYHYTVNHSAWITKSDAEKIDLVGRENWYALQKLFDRIDERNDFVSENKTKFSTSNINPYNDNLKLLDEKCGQAVEQVRQKVDWLKNALTL